MSEENMRRAFYQLSRSYYADASIIGPDSRSGKIDEVMFGLYAEGGGTQGEMSVQWSKLGRGITPQLCAYDDSWEVLQSFKDVIDMMAKYDNQSMDPVQFCAMLESLGFVDDTEEVNPNAPIAVDVKKETRYGIQGRSSNTTGWHDCMAPAGQTWSTPEEAQEAREEFEREHMRLMAYDETRLVRINIETAEIL